MKKTEDYSVILALFFLALFIWLRDISWITSSDDTLPILVAIPLFYWIGSPWHLRVEPLPLSYKGLLFTALLFLIGIITNVTLILTLGWTCLLWTWLAARVTEVSLPSVKKLLILPIMAFPWIALDADRLGWWFRLSGAFFTAKLLTFFGMDVQHEGTLLFVNHIQISVEAACAGLNMLQSMLIAGSVVVYLTLGETNRYWWNLPVLVFMSWFSNTIRIILISLAAIEISPRFATGEFHQWGGWAILLLMFCLSWLFFAWQQPKKASS